MNIKLLGKNLDDIRPILGNYGLNEVDSGMELIVTYGGDGALLSAERDFPGVPKLAIRDAATAPTCPAHEADKVLSLFVDGKLKKTELPKLCAHSSQGELLAVNDLFLHNLDRSTALRYQVSIDGELYAAEVRGDGVCLSSVHGSTAYYRCITRGVFRVGIGLAFSNSMVEVDHLVLDSASVVELTVLRGPGVVIADNSPEQLIVNEGECVTFRQCDEKAVVYGLDGFMCSRCRKIRHGI